MSDMLPEFITVRTQHLVTVLAEAKFSPSVSLYGDAQAQAIADVRALPLAGRETIALPEPPDRWEYKVVMLPAAAQSETGVCEAALAPYGREGWECFHVGGALWMKRRLP